MQVGEGQEGEDNTSKIATINKMYVKVSWDGY